MPGDISWALKLEDSLEDFKFLDSLPGKKIILKGNHDLWWSTVKKLNEFLKNNEIENVEIKRKFAAVLDASDLQDYETSMLIEQKSNEFAKSEL